VTLLQSVPSFHGLQEGPFQVIDVSSLLSPLISSPWISNRQGHRPLEVQRLIEGPRGGKPKRSPSRNFSRWCPGAVAVTRNRTPPGEGPRVISPSQTETETEIFPCSQASRRGRRDPRSLAPWRRTYAKGR